MAMKAPSARITNPDDFSFSHSASFIKAATTGTAMASGAGTLRSVVVTNAGSAADLALYDGTSTAGTQLAAIDGDTLGTYEFNVSFTTGLFAVYTATTTAGAVTTIFDVD